MLTRFYIETILLLLLVHSRADVFDDANIDNVLKTATATNDPIEGSNFREAAVECATIRRNEIEEHLSTKTPYRAIANLDETPQEYSDCHPTRIWSVIRHGTRNPSKSVIENAKHLLSKLKERILVQANKTRICDNELVELQKWQFNISSKEEKYLVAEGEDELIELAERMQNRFSKLLPAVYTPSHYLFKYTATQRTLKSAQSFATGLFGRHRISEIMYPEALHKDPILRFYKLCNRWKINVKKNPETLFNAHKFLDEPEMQAAVDYIRHKTQIDDLTPQDAQLIYMICAFETAWHRRKPHSVWCNFFDRETIKALEFAKDLEYYWKDGYGYELTHRIACPAIADMFDFIAPESKKPNATFYFTHSGTMLKVLAHLGLYNDTEPLTHKDFHRRRHWHTSSIDAFASNIAFLLYECPKAEPMVLTLHQERVVRIPGCDKHHDLCSLNTLRQLFANSLNNCKFDELCQI